MPLRKKAPELKNLCIDNITRNIMTHGELFKKCENNGKVYVRYKIIQSLFTDQILQRLSVLFREQQGYDDGKLMKFKNFLTHFCESRNLDDWPCLEFLFNDKTTCIDPFLYAMDSFWNVGDLLPFIASRCKNLKRLNGDIVRLCDMRIRRLVPQFRNICSVELKDIYDERVAQEILENCHLLRKLSARVYCESDTFLFSLCKHCSQHKMFVFCPERGNCSEAGKHLESLRITLVGNGKVRSGKGIACALQHLPLLEDLYELPMIQYKGHMSCIPDVPKGIMILRNGAVDSGQQSVLLQLTTLFFFNNMHLHELHAVTLTCPKLRSVQVALFVTGPQMFSLDTFENLKELHFCDSTNEQLNSMEIKQFLAAKGKKLTALSFISDYQDLAPASVNNILDSCCNLKQLHFENSITCNQSCKHISLSCAASLEKIIFKDHKYSDSPHRCSLFHDLLCKATNVKFLTIHGHNLQRDYPHFMESIDLRFLEELHIIKVDVSENPLKKLLNEKNNLRKITFDRCMHQSRCAEELKNIATENNYELKIEQIGM